MKRWFVLLGGMLAASVAAAATLSVTTGNVVVRRYRPQVTVLAEGQSMNRMVIDAPFSGVMAALPLPPGTAASRGTIIARVFPLKLSAEAQAATADVRSTRRAYEQAKVLERTGLTTAAGLDAARARARHARAVLQGLNARLARGVIRAPFVGTIRYEVPAGAWVSPGTAIARLSGTGELYLTARLTPGMVQQLKPGAAVLIAARGKRWPGQIYAIGQRAGRGGLVTVYARCSCPLLAGEFARLTVRGAGQPGLAVVRRAVVMNAGQAVVYRITDGRARPVEVSIVHTTRRWAWIAGAVSAGDSVIVAGAGRVRAGTAVRAKPGIQAKQ